MDVVLKRRLVGAGVIGVIAMVVVPMLLDGPDWKQPDAAAGPVVSRNAQGEKVVSVSLYGDPSNPAEPTAASDSAVTGYSPPARALNNGNTSAAEQAAAAREIAARQQAVREQRAREAEARRLAAEREAQQRAAAQAEQRASSQSSTAASRGDSRATQPALNDERSGWVVQLGTFSNEENANRLLKKLEAANRPAWKTPITNRAGRTLYRVRVGPEVSREAADRSAIQLAKQFSLQPRVMELR